MMDRCQNWMDALRMLGRLSFRTITVFYAIQALSAEVPASGTTGSNEHGAILQALSLNRLEGSNYQLPGLKAQLYEDGTIVVQYDIRLPLTDPTASLGVDLYPERRCYRAVLLQGAIARSKSAEEPDGETGSTLRNYATRDETSMLFIDRVGTRLAGVSGGTAWKNVGRTLTILDYDDECFHANPTPYGTHWVGPCESTPPRLGRDGHGTPVIRRMLLGRQQNFDWLDPRLGTRVLAMAQMRFGAGSVHTVISQWAVGEVSRELTVCGRETFSSTPIGRAEIEPGSQPDTTTTDRVQRQR